LVALDRAAAVAGGAERGIDLLGQRVDLAAAVAGGDHQKVVQRSDAPHIENCDVTGLVVECDASTENGTLQARRQLGGDCATDGGGAQWTSFALGAREPEAQATTRTRSFSVVVALPAAAISGPPRLAAGVPNRTRGRPALSLPV